jgi:hypothetical protein
MLFSSEQGFNINSGLAVGVTPLEDILKQGAPVPKHMGSGQRRWNGDGRTLSDSIWQWIIFPKKYRNYNRCLLLKYFVTECWLGINLPRLFPSAQGQGTAAGEEQQEATWACCEVWLVFKKNAHQMDKCWWHLAATGCALVLLIEVWDSTPVHLAIGEHRPMFKTHLEV